jgi:probable addiction module antidote protein
MKAKVNAIRKRPLKLKRFDAADHLHSLQDCSAYLAAIMDEPDVDEKLIAAALGDIARAQGMMQVARASGLAREALYRALSPDGNPTFGTILKVSRALGLKISWHAE